MISPGGTTTGRETTMPEAATPTTERGAEAVVGRHVGVVGGGTMGAGIAICTVRLGIPTTLLEVDAERAEAAGQRVRAFLRAGVERGKLSGPDHDRAVAALEVTVDAADLATCDVVIEAVYEDVAVKRALWTALDEVTAPDALFVTNTSTLSVTAIAAGSRHPERVVGMHFCNPAPLMPLVEIVPGVLTSPAAERSAVAFAEQLGKVGVRVRDTPGFIVNRFLIPFENDAIRLLDRREATVEEIDRAVTVGMGHPMGPFTLLDIVGLDIHHAVSLRLYEQLKDPKYAPPPLVDRMIAAGHLGRKTGQGFYTYDGASMFGA